MSLIFLKNGVVKIRAKQESIMRTNYQKRQFAEHGETDLKNSWYWDVLVKNMGSWAKAKEIVLESKKRYDPTYNLEWKIKI